MDAADITDTRLLAVYTLAKSKFPDLRIELKSESALIRLLNRYVRVFNPDFMVRYATTLGTTIYVPSTDFVLRDQVGFAELLAHELVHMDDEKRSGAARHTLRYGAPQLVAALALPLLLPALILMPLMPGRKSALGALILSTLGAIVGSALLSPWLLLLALPLAALAPLPSRGRAEIEAHGYTMSMAVRYWLTYDVFAQNVDGWIEWRVKNSFEGPDYYYMARGRGAAMRSKLQKNWERIRSGDILHDPIFYEVFEALSRVS